MHAFEKETNEIITHLEDAYSKIQVINNLEMEWLKSKILMDIKRHIDSLKLQLGQEPAAGPDNNLPTFGPLKKMFGKDITVTPNKPADVNKPFQQSVADVELMELRMKADELYPRFLSTPSDHLLDSLSDIEIRAVAKKAGLPITETNPNRLTTTYIDQIKNAIRQKNSTQGSNVPSLGDEQRYAEFYETANKEILELFTENEIREFARRAGLPVTKVSPAKIDSKFLSQIKTAIKKNAELDAVAGV